MAHAAAAYITEASIEMQTQLWPVGVFQARKHVCHYEQQFVFYLSRDD